ncbi:MAG TPA: hypothetical protein VGN11_08450 [Candidatus Baltobacteraceae bacterium]|nr:hypothetical protein [Candidatus Baltobacteraceae bacterium]
MIRTPHVPACVFALAAIVALMAGCGGGGSGNGAGVIPNQPGTTASPQPSGPPVTDTPTPTPTVVPTAVPTAPGSSTQTIVASEGAVNGESNMFTPNEGDMSTGGQGSPIDGITCDATMSSVYHVHAFLGLYVNGKLVALPPGVGMDKPVRPVHGFVNFAKCFYHIHTHDSSGIVHIEDPNPNNVPVTQSLYKLQNFLDIWGVTADANHFGPFTGPVRVFTSGQVFRGNAPGATTPATDLTYFGADPNSVPLYSYEVVYVEVGPTFPTTLPNVHFYVNQ